MKKLVLLIAFWALAAMAGAATVDTVSIECKAMGKYVPNLVVLPESYSQGKRLPVLYLLHGAGGDYRSWLRTADLATLADVYHMIIVCPDGGSTSWYFDSPVDAAWRYETYMTTDLVTYIDFKYKTRANRGGRAITGLSMGGHGALYLAIRHPDIWGAAGSMSGGVDFRPFPNNWDIALRLGPYIELPDTWVDYTVVGLVRSLKPNTLKIIFDCGVDDFFYTVNKQLHEKLLEKKIPHDYTERPGAHTGEYWGNAVKYQMLYFSLYFR